MVDDAISVVGAVLSEGVMVVKREGVHCLGICVAVAATLWNRGVFFCFWMAPSLEVCHIAVDIVVLAGLAVVVLSVGGKCIESCRYDIPGILCS